MRCKAGELICCKRFVKFADEFANLLANEPDFWQNTMMMAYRYNGHVFVGWNFSGQTNSSRQLMTEAEELLRKYSRKKKTLTHA